jgi:hypothetical protein
VSGSLNTLVGLVCLLFGLIIAIALTRRGSSLSDFASFLLKREAQDQPISEAELRDAASRLRSALMKRGFEVGEIFGSSTDLWGFGIATEFCEILVDVSPPEITFDKRWGIQVLLSDPGWFRAVRERRTGEMKRVELAVHDALSNDFSASDVVWLLEPGRVNRRMRLPAP